MNYGLGGNDSQLECRYDFNIRPRNSRHAVLIKIDSHWNHFQFVGKCKLFVICNQHQNWTGRN
jgi:hypothetical protein